MVYELRDIALRLNRRNSGFQLSEEEPVVSAAFLLRDVCGLPHFLEGADHVTLAARHVEGGGGNPSYGAAANQALPDDLTVDHRRGLKYIPREVELIGNLRELGEGVCEIPLAGSGDFGPTVPLTQTIGLGSPLRLEPFTMDISAAPVNDC